MSENIKVTDTDKNQHLSKSLSDIQDYGPAGAPEDFVDFKDSHREDPRLVDLALEDEVVYDDDDESGYTTQIATAPVKRKLNAPLIVLSVALLLLAVFSAAGGYYFHSMLNQVHAQLTQLRSQALPHPENNALAALEQRIVSLESQLSELRNGSAVAANTDTGADSSGLEESAPAPSESSVAE